MVNYFVLFVQIKRLINIVIDKTFLITEFLKGKTAIFYTATKVGPERNLELFSKQVMEVLDPEYTDATFSSLENVLNIITKK